MRIAIFILIILLVMIFSLFILFLLDFLDGHWQAKRPSCDNLPEKDIVEEIYAQHIKNIKEIEQELGSNIGFSLEEHSDCSNKEYIVIMYGTRADQKRIQEILGETFFGVPYRMQNI